MSCSPGRTCLRGVWLHGRPCQYNPGEERGLPKRDLRWHRSAEADVPAPESGNVWWEMGLGMKTMASGEGHGVGLGTGSYTTWGWFGLDGSRTPRPHGSKGHGCVHSEGPGNLALGQTSPRRGSPWGKASHIAGVGGPPGLRCWGRSDQKGPLLFAFLQETGSHSGRVLSKEEHDGQCCGWLPAICPPVWCCRSASIFLGVFVDRNPSQFQQEVFLHVVVSMALGYRYVRMF